ALDEEQRHSAAVEPGRLERFHDVPGRQVDGHEDDVVGRRADGGEAGALVRLGGGMGDFEPRDPGGSEAEGTAVVTGTDDHDLGNAAVERRERHAIEERRAARHALVPPTAPPPERCAPEGFVQAALRRRVARRHLGPVERRTRARHAPCRDRRLALLHADTLPTAHAPPDRFSIVGVLEAIGDTPLVRLDRLRPAGGAELWVKLEAANPTGSYKDRMALAMIEGAERDGRLRPGQPVVEYTGGSTGSSLALVCAVKGYPLRIVSSDAFAHEKIRTMQAFGAEVELIPSPAGITPELVPAMVARAEEIAAETGAFWTDQFNNR